MVHDLFDGFSMKIFFPPLYQNATDFSTAFCDRTFVGYQENNALYKLKRMVQHEAFQFPVVLSAPMGAGKKGPTDLNFTLSGFKSEVP